MTQPMTHVQAVRATTRVREASLGARLRRIVFRKSTLAFALVLPLIVLIGGLILYPFGYSIYLSMLNKAETRFVGLDNFRFLFRRETFWMVVQQSVIFTVTAVFFKSLLGFILAHLINVLPNKRQRLWRGLSLVPWVMPPALSSLGWWWLLDPSYSAINWIITSLGGVRIAFLADPYWARFSVILVNIWYGSPFFMIMYLAGLKSVPADLYEAAEIDGATRFQRLRYVTIPMMRNIIAVTVLFSTIVTFANFDIVRVLTNGGPRGMTELFGTWAFKLGIQSGDIPQAAAVSLFLFPILAVLAFFILRNVSKRASEI
jgi:multiple sugar transport system permease protein